MATTANIIIEDLPGYPGIKTIHASGELDESNLPELESAVSPLIQDSNSQTLIFNFNGLEFMSSKIIGYLAGLHTTLSSNNKKIILTEFDQTIFDILSLVGMDQIVECHKTMDEVINSIAKQQN